MWFLIWFRYVVKVFPMFQTIIIKWFNLQAADILDYCQSNIEKGEDKCDNIYRGYKCFWEGVKSFSDEKKVPFSIYDSLRFDRLLDETEDM